MSYSIYFVHAEESPKSDRKPWEEPEFHQTEIGYGANGRINFRFPEGFNALDAMAKATGDPQRYLARECGGGSCENVILAYFDGVDLSALAARVKQLRREEDTE